MEGGLGCLGMEDWATESRIVQRWTEGWDWCWISSVGLLALCALARKQKPWDWTRMAGPRRVGDGEGMKCNGPFCLGFNFGEIQLVGLDLTIGFLKPCERQLVGLDLTTKF